MALFEAGHDEELAKRGKCVPCIVRGVFWRARPTTFRQFGSKRMTFPAQSGEYLSIATTNVAADRGATIAPQSSQTLDGVEHAQTGAVRNAGARGDLRSTSTPHETLNQRTAVLPSVDLVTAIDLLSKLRQRFDKIGGPSSIVHGGSMRANVDLMRDVDAFLAVHRASSAR